MAVKQTFTPTFSSAHHVARKIAFLVCAVVCALVLSACSSESNSGSSSSDSAQGSQTAQDAQPSTGGDIAAPSNSGKLQVIGAQLSSESGAPVQLRGVSTHGLAWFPQYVNQDFFIQLRKDWGVNVVRLALYTAEYGGYCTDGNKAQLEQLVIDGVNYAEAADLYAVVDWHVLADLDPNVHIEDAKAFFDKMSAQFADKNNVIYEICNEPNGSTTWAQIKQYANTIIPIIRANDPDAVVVVGTPTWSQDVNDATADPLEFDNVMYTLHFYAASHQQELRNKLKTAVESGTPVFVTEFGICEASGDGAIDYQSADAWIELMDELDVSYICWNLSNKDETSAFFLSKCDKTSGFTVDDLSDSAKWFVDELDSPAFED